MGNSPLLGESSQIVKVIVLLSVLFIYRFPSVCSKAAVRALLDLSPFNFSWALCVNTDGSSIRPLWVACIKKTVKVAWKGSGCLSSLLSCGDSRFNN